MFRKKLSDSAPGLWLRRLMFFWFALALALIFFQTGQKPVNAQAAPSFGCEMLPPVRVCLPSGCVTGSPICYPANLEDACPDSNGVCYAVESQNTCEQYHDDPNTEFDECGEAGPFTCIQVPCSTNDPTFSCTVGLNQLTQQNMCFPNDLRYACPSDEANDICYRADIQQCSQISIDQCTTAGPINCVRVACSGQIAPPAPSASPTPGVTATPAPAPTFNCSWQNIMGQNVCTPVIGSCPREVNGRCYQINTAACASHGSEEACGQAGPQNCTEVPCATPTPGGPTPTPGGGGMYPPNPNPPPYSAPERAIPQPYVDCGSTESPEFHSLRPYQASPCFRGLAQLALYCANTLILVANVEFSPGSCTTTCGADCTCTTSCYEEFVLSAVIDVRDAELPIMGNTEDDIVNSQEQPDPEGIDHYAKLNEYVSWYLNGVNQRAEYDPPDPSTSEGRKLVIDFSGPLKKLLSWESLTYERLEQVDRAGDQGTPEFDEGGRHNQVVTCTGGENEAAGCYTGGGSPLRVNYWTGSRRPPLMSEYDDIQEYREALSDWRQTPNSNLFQYVPLSSTEDRKGILYIADWELECIGITCENPQLFAEPANLFFAHMEETRELTDLLQRTYVSRDLMDDGQINVQGVSTEAPQPQVLQSQAYRATCHFQGGQCAIIDPCPSGWELVDPNFCNDPSGLSCQQFDLYGDCRPIPPPPGTTACPANFPVCTDLTGSFCTNAPGIPWSQGCPLAGGQTGSCCIWQDPEPNCGGHLESCCGTVPSEYCDPYPSGLTCESIPGSDPTCCLPDDPECNAGVPLPSSTPAPTSTPGPTSTPRPPGVINTHEVKNQVPANPPECDLLMVRTNPGDSLIPGEIPITLTFTASATCTTQGEITCDEAGYCECTPPAGATCPGGQVILTLTLNELMPLAHENFNRIVSSPYSPLQKVFPKMGENSPIRGKLDMPAYSLVTYVVEGDFSLAAVINPGQPPYPLPPKLFYPHVGSIHQYLLQCIQKAIRPQGYGLYCPEGRLAPDYVPPEPTISFPTGPVPTNPQNTPRPPNTPGPTFPPATPPIPTGPFPPGFDCSDILPYPEYLDLRLGRCLDNPPPPIPAQCQNRAAPWPLPGSTNELTYNLPYENTQCSIDPAQDAWAMCFALYAADDAGPGCGAAALRRDLEEIQNLAIEMGINPLLALALAAHESAFGCTSGDYLGAQGGGTLRRQMGILANWVSQVENWEQLMCVWKSGFEGLRYCEPFCNRYDPSQPSGCACLDDPPPAPGGMCQNPDISLFPDEMRFWLEIFGAQAPAQCQITPE